MISRRIITSLPEIARIVSAHHKALIFIKVAVATSPYFLLAVGQEFISDSVSLLLFIYLAFSIKAPIWILSGVFGLLKANEVKFDWKTKKWAAWWFSMVVMGGLSFGYWFLKKYQYAYTEPEELFLPYNVVVWMLLLAVAGYYVTGLTERDYLINVFNFSDTDFKKNGLDFQTHVLPEHTRTVKGMIISKAGKKAYQTFDKVSFFHGLSMGFFAVLPVILFHGGTIFIDSIVFFLMIYSIILDPEHMSSHEERFYTELMSNFKDPVSTSKIITFASVCALGGAQVLKGNLDLTVLFIDLVLVILSLVSVAKAFPDRMAWIALPIGTLLVFLASIVNSNSLLQSIGYSLVPILAFLTVGACYSLIGWLNQRKKFTKTTVYSISSLIAFVACTLLVAGSSKQALLVFIGEGLFLGLIFFAAVLGERL
jgi:hypothetical protein